MGLPGPGFIAWVQDIPDIFARACILDDRNEVQTMTILNKKLGELHPYANNPRINDRAVEPVAKSIEQYGFKVPMVITADGEIVCGHTRYKAAQLLGLDEVPCVVADDLTPEQVKAFRLVDNKTAELAGWDFEALQVELDGLDDGLTEFGFGDEVISDFDLEGLMKVDDNKPKNRFDVVVTCQSEKEQEAALKLLKDNCFLAKAK